MAAVKGDLQYLARRYSHPRDERITFQETDAAGNNIHRYTVQWTGDPTRDAELNQRYMSVSSLIHAFFEDFDPDQVLNDNYDRWSADGHAHHLMCEFFYNGQPPPRPATRVVDQFLRFTQDHAQLVPWRTEMLLWTDEATLLTGTPDMLFLDPHPNADPSVLNVLLMDWKNSKEIKFANRFRRGAGCCAHLDDCNFAHYTLQLNIYKWMLEQFYRDVRVDGRTYDRIQVTEMHLVVMHDTLSADRPHVVMHGDLPAYQKVPVAPCPQVVAAMVAQRAAHVRQGQKRTLYELVRTGRACISARPWKKIKHA
jgi:hypothetical protein